MTRDKEIVPRAASRVPDPLCPFFPLGPFGFFCPAPPDTRSVEAAESLVIPGRTQA